MILSLYLIKKFFNALLVCGGISYAIFFIFSLIGNLGEKFSFNSILYLSALNSFQIFTFIPSHLYILSFCLIIMHLKSKNELIIIKEYIELKKLLLIIFPILVLFVFIEIKKDSFSVHIEKMKLNLSNSKNFEDTKIFISTDGNKTKYSIFSKVDSKNATINQYLEFDVENQKVKRGEISNSLNIENNNLFSKESIVYENNDFQYKFLNKKLFDNFTSIWDTNAEKIKTNFSNSKNFENRKIFISTDGNKSKYSIFSEVDSKNETINQYLEFDIENQKIKRGLVSNSLKIQNNNLFSNESIIYENNDFRYEFLNKKLFDDFTSIWSTNAEKIIKNNENNKNSNYKIFQSILFHSFFYLCISMIFLSKKLVKRNINIIKIFSLILLIFLYHLLIPKIMVNNFYFFFQSLSLIVFILIFFKNKKYE